jgi:hypothetical protein
VTSAASALAVRSRRMIDIMTGQCEDVRTSGETASDGDGRIERSRPYHLLLWALRVGWFACTFAIFAMILALILRSPQFVMAYRIGLLAVWAALAEAGVMFLVVIGRFRELSQSRRFGARAAALVARLLADLLDPSGS